MRQAGQLEQAGGGGAAARIGVVGLGAIGCAVAARLVATRRRGERFGFAAGSEAAARAIRAYGFTLRDGQDVLRAQPSWLDDARAPGADPSRCDQLGAGLAPWPDGRRYQLILLCTRAEATRGALDSLLPLLDDDGVILCLQNGLPEGPVAARAGAGRTLGAVIGWSATSAGPGRSEVTGRGGFILGALAPEGRRHLAAASALLSRAFPTQVSGNLAGARWSKLALNCAISTLGALSGLSFGQLAGRRDARALALRCIGEVCAVARAQGVQLARISGLDPRWLADDGAARLSRRLARPLQHALFWLVARQRPSQRSGMLARLLAGRTSGQIDDLNGAVVEEARRAGLPVPINARLVDRIHAIERGEAEIGPDQLAACLD